MMEQGGWNWMEGGTGGAVVQGIELQGRFRCQLQ